MLNHMRNFIGVFAHIFISRQKFHIAVSIDLNHLPGIISSRLILQDNALDLLRSHIRTDHTAGGGFLDGAGQRAFSAAGNTSGARHASAGKNAGNNKELIVRTQRIAFRIQLSLDKFIDQAALAIDLPFFFEWLIMIFFGTGVDAQYLHRTGPAFLYFYKML